jgi:hypothetical protein
VPSAKVEQDLLVARQEVERFKEDVAVLQAHLAGLEQENLRAPVFMQKLGRYFGFGAAGKQDWVRFKLNYKQEELERCQIEQARLDTWSNRSDAAPELPATPAACFRR